MGWVLMSERDLKRVETLAQVDDGHIGVTVASHLMNMSRRHVYRLLDRFRSEILESSGCGNAILVQQTTRVRGQKGN
jgi:predicted DNA-binding protein (UPF0251 family)